MSVLRSLQEADRLFGAENAKLAAQEFFNNALGAIFRTPYRLSPAETAFIAKYIGREVLSTQKKESSNDHKMIAIARDECRAALQHLFPHNTDVSTTLHVGSTMQEVGAWSSHAGHDFSFHLSEDKDVVRMYEGICAKVGAKLRKLSLPSVTSVKGASTQLTIHGLKEAFSLLSAGQRDRFFLGDAPYEKRYDTLFLEDCIYEMSPSDMARLFKRHDAKVAYAVGFFPNAFIYSDVAPSPLYNLEVYFPIIEHVEEAIDLVWPYFLTFAPMLPVEGMMEVLKEGLRFALTKGWSVFSAWVGSVADSTFPLGLLFGNICDILKFGPIFTCIFERMRDFLREQFARVRVVWKSGFSNGYDHKYGVWKKWVAKARFHIEGNYYLDSEIVHRAGEMYIIKFWPSSAKNPIVRSLEVPKHLLTVQVADIEGAWNKGTGLGEMSYFPVNAADWFKIINWGLAEAKGSLTFPILMTMVNRVRGGLSLASNILVEEMEMEDEDVAKIALAALMEIFQRLDVISAIEDDKELRDGYASNISHILKLVAKVGVVVATGGVAYGAYYLYKWLVTQEKVFSFVKYPSPPKVTKHAAAKQVKSQSGNSVGEVENIHLNLTIPHAEIKTKVECLLCDMQLRGSFSANGIPEDGQKFVCTKHDTDNLHEIGFEGAAMMRMLQRVRDAITDHEKLNATKLLPVIGAVKRWVEANSGGVTRKVRVVSVRGGPGTGKTEVIKSVARRMMKDGINVAISMPFRNLLGDYSNATTLGFSDKMDFPADTFWYTAKRENSQVLIVDEMTAVDWDFIQLMALYVGAKSIYLVGDRMQTCLNAQSGEGIDPTNPQSTLDWSRVPEHDLVMNYRLNAWMVKLLNHLYGYQMIAVRSDYAQPRFLTRAEYKAHAELVQIEQEKVFAHRSARATFGCESSKDRDSNENMSVRSSQGQTYKTMACSAAQTDSDLIDTHGMLCVAISRSKGELCFVTPEALTDPVIMRVQKLLHCDSKERIDAIASLPWPVIKQAERDFVLSDEEKAVEKVLSRISARGGITVEKRVGMDDDITITQISSQDSRVIDLDAESAFSVPKFPLEEFFQNTFNLCAFDAFEGQVPSDVIRKAKYVYCERLFYADVPMGRKPAEMRTQVTEVHKGPRTATSFSTEWTNMPGWWHPKDMVLVLTKAEGKLLLPFNGVMKYCYESFGPFALFGVGQDTPARVYDGGVVTTVKTAVCLDGNHLSSYEMPKVIVKFDAHVQPTKVSPLDVWAGKYVFTYANKKQPNKLTYRVLPDIVGATSTALDALRTASQLAQLDVPSQIGVTFSEQAAQPTFIRVPSSGLERRFEEIANRRSPITSSWMRPSVAVSEPIFRSTPLKLGTDAYRLGDLIDPSAAVTVGTDLNDVHAIRGLTTQNNIKLQWEGFIGRRTASGRLTSKAAPSFLRQAPGMANAFYTDPVSTLTAASRLGRKMAKPRLTFEAREWCRMVADKLYRERFVPDYRRDPERMNFAAAEALKAARQRNYGGRAVADFYKRFSEPTLVVSNKAQQKPIKEGKLDIGKGGQAIMQSPPIVNLEFISWMRQRCRATKEAANASYFLDDYEDAGEFRKRLSMAIRDMPASSKIAIADFEMFDAQQNEVTLEIERQFALMAGSALPDVAAYYKIRGCLPFRMFGKFSGRTTGEKGSGFPDTKSGNTTLASALANYTFTGAGPSIMAAKGDDILYVQSGAQIDPEATKLVRDYTGMRSTGGVGDGGEFIGNSVSRAGIYPSITRTAMKARCKPARDYKMFCEQQKALRDTLKEWRDCGIQECVVYGAEAEGKKIGYVETCLAYVNSMSHINEAQWRSRTQMRRQQTFHLNAASGPTLF